MDTWTAWYMFDYSICYESNTLDHYSTQDEFPPAATKREQRNKKVLIHQKKKILERITLFVIASV